MVARIDENGAFALRDALDRDEHSRLSPLATRSDTGLRRRHDQQQGYRQQFAVDADRILHSRAYTRYIDKTQVFCLVNNDHITHRVLHVQLVSRIARTIGRFLYLNEDLIEAIALGHDLGHPPFGHDGERFLSELCQEHGLPPFQHNLQSVRFLEHLERGGRGCNLTLQTLDGILCHDGETSARWLTPDRELTFRQFEQKLQAKTDDPKHQLVPATPEGCVVRLADSIAYIGRDIEDAITLGLVARTDIPAECRRILGETNGTIVYNLVTDLIANSRVPAPEATIDSDSACAIGFSPEVAAALRELKHFNYRNIYLAPATKKDMPLIGRCYRALFHSYLKRPTRDNDWDHQRISPSAKLTDLDHNQQPAVAVRDVIAGMTDDFFLRQAENIGCAVPAKR
ncbi:MAG: deoxyguanosinetriphosphate triphosphohydrolase family protein [Desulfopila sp.]